MLRGAWVAALAAVLLWLTGCAATGPKGSEIASSLGAVPQGYGRVVFFRSSSIVGAAVQPEIRLDGQVVGQSKPGGFFYVDASPGKHSASASTETTSALEIHVVSGQTHYVRSAIGMGLLVGRVVLTVEGQVTARAELPELSYTGVAPVRIGAAGAAAAPAAPTAATVQRAPDLKRGDQLIYRVTDKLTGLTREVIYTVDRVGPEQITFNQGGRVEGRNGTVVSVNSPLAGAMDRCNPPGGWTRPEMTLGMAWSADFVRPPGGGCAGGFRLKSRVVSEEPMPTPLGELTVQRVDIEGDIQRTERYTYQTRVNARAWYSPALARVVRFESEFRGPAAPDRELIELIEVRRD
jgi:hypothetical protein